MSPLEVGAVVRVQFRLPRTEHDVEATARVAWSDLRAGMGLEFQEVASGDLAAIEEFVDRRTARKGGRRSSCRSRLTPLGAARRMLLAFCRASVGHGGGAGRVVSLPSREPKRAVLERCGD